MKVIVLQEEVEYNLRQYIIEAETYATIYGTVKTIFWIKNRTHLVACNVHEVNERLEPEQVQKLIKENYKYWIESFGEMVGNIGR